MMGYLDRLNLRPFEKRLVVGVGAVLFLVLNAWFVVPHFSDLRQARDRQAEALKKIERWQVEIDQSSKYQAGIKKFIWYKPTKPWTRPENNGIGWKMAAAPGGGMIGVGFAGSAFR